MKSILRSCLICISLLLIGIMSSKEANASEPGGNLLLGDPQTRAVYLLLEGQKRLVPDTATLEALGFSLDEVNWEASDTLARTASGPNLLPFSMGDLIRDEQTGAIYFLDGGKRLIQDKDTLQACGWSDTSTRLIPSALAAVIPAGKPFPALRAGDLIRRAEDGCLYLLAGGKHWLADLGPDSGVSMAELLAACGWQERDVQDIEPLLVALIPEKGLIPSLYFGCLLQSSEETDERIYVLEAGKHLIPDKATFEAYGWPGSRIWKLLPEVLEAIPEGAPLLPMEKGENPFADRYWGQCTWYVAERRIAPSYRSAKYWYADAKANGFAVGQRPMAGAIIVYNSGHGRGEYGHVAYVRAAYADDSFALADSNICGWQCVRTRITDLRQEVGVLGFVYWKYGATD